ncbi:tRNA pseudouridine(13) synthase TruD [Streptomyces albulus]|uniref:tRNA pseudouridine(13) synthase TruD n=1 Tax=Streptomyces noursei TaxID=1971 RepID=UPI001F38ABF2|nr:tRNA pseudouridine(13) synthase TruD [Streptomyces noursei]MCE4948117.1 tRNA pseudouridine(13) synthase TruD [Streptomyces noursei]
MTLEYPVLKARHTDFIVQETIVLPVQDEPDAPYQYLRLRKCGYTTFEAIDRIAAVCGVPASDVTAAGLKDEDAVTEQHIACRGGLAPDRIAEFNARHSAGDRAMSLTPHGYGRQDLRAGHLEGNGFRITVRGLSPTFAAALDGLGERTRDLFFVNYYDTQRFGVAGGPKTTHHIGRALLENDHQTALDLVRASRSAEAEHARRFAGPAAGFFDAIDPRVRAFYLCAHASYVWNEQLTARLRQFYRHPLDETHRDGIPYAFATHRDDVLSLLRRVPTLSYVRYRWTDGAIRRTEGLRPTVVQTRVRVERTGEDTDTPGRYACELALFLPTGCYATNAVAQWVAWTARTAAASDL